MKCSLLALRLLAFLLLTLPGLPVPPAIAGTAPAAKQTLKQPLAQPMLVRLVRSEVPGCEPACAEWLSAEGKITAGTVAEFRNAIKQMGARNLPVFIYSGGGDVNAAFAIGRLIRARKLDVFVAMTDFETCLPGDRTCAARQKAGLPLGTPQAMGASCASACAFILAGGVERHAAPWNSVGVHRAISNRTQIRVLRQFRVTWKLVNGRKVETSRTLVAEREVNRRTITEEAPERLEAPMEKFVREMGVADELLKIMDATPNKDMHWLTSDELTATHIVTDRSGGPDYVRRWHAAAREVHAAALAATVPRSDVHPVVPQPLATRPAAVADAGAPFVETVAKNVPVGDRRLNFNLRATRDAPRGLVLFSARPWEQNRTVHTWPITVSLMLPSGHSFVAGNSPPNSDIDPLLVAIPAAEFCILLRDATVKMGYATSDTLRPDVYSVVTILFQRSEIAETGMCSGTSPTPAPLEAQTRKNGPGS